MTIGPDIQEALDELGISAYVQKYNPISDSFYFTTAQEKIFYKTNTQATRSFVREFFLEASIGYQSQIESGTVIKVHSTPFIVTSKTPVYFEDEIIKSNVVLYKCNVSGELQSLSGESDWDRTTMKKNILFKTKYVNVYALLTELGSSNINTDLPIPPIGDTAKQQHQLYLSSDYHISERDRFIINSGEVYKVDVVFNHVLINVDLAVLSKDTR